MPPMLIRASSRVGAGSTVGSPAPLLYAAVMDTVGIALAMELGHGALDGDKGPSPTSCTLHDGLRPK